MQLNRLASDRCDLLLRSAAELRIEVASLGNGARLVDCGVHAAGGLQAGIGLAEVCLAGLGCVSLAPARSEFAAQASICVFTDQPVAACMASQYAGWRISSGNYFAMASGPMRAAAGREQLFDHIGFREQPDCAVGVLESGKLPPQEVCAQIAADCCVPPDRLTLLVARTASLAGAVQVTARTVETALHKLHELKFDLARVASGFGVAPLPPIGGDDLAALGRTNDAVLYGGQVTLWVRGDDESLQSIGPQIPSSASPDYGRPFAEVFAHYEYDFYKIDPLLFSPAVISLVNLDTGRTHRFGEINPAVLAQSFLS